MLAELSVNPLRNGLEEKKKREILCGPAERRVREREVRERGSRTTRRQRSSRVKG